jgi:hypothetical protein
MDNINEIETLILEVFGLNKKPIYLFSILALPAPRMGMLMKIKKYVQRASDGVRCKCTSLIFSLWRQF